jgi:Concanavalin A-like lectin/glucanases superfamily
MAKRYYNLEKETKEYLKACEAKSIVNQTNIKTLNDFVINRKTRNLNTTFLANSPIVLGGLVVWLDAGVSDSYPAGGTVWRDLASSNNGTLTNGPTFSKSNGGSLVFDGVDDFAEITNNNSLSFGSGEFTIEVFFKPKVSQTGGNFPAIINKSVGDFTNPVSTSGVTGWILFWISNRYEFRLGDSSTTFNSITFPSLVTNDDTWRYLAVTIPADSSLIKGYYNGNMVITGTKTLTNDTNTNVSLTINSWRQFGRRLNSQTASVKLYNRTLTPSEILQNYNAMKGRFGL